MADHSMGTVAFDSVPHAIISHDWLLGVVRWPTAEDS